MLAKIFYLCYYNFRDDVCMENIIIDSGIYIVPINFTVKTLIGVNVLTLVHIIQNYIQAVKKFCTR